jgi:hypothetical protein
MESGYGIKNLYHGRKSYLAVKLGKPVNSMIWFIQNFVLVDVKKGVRGFMMA